MPPYKSDAQRKFFHANIGKKGITKSLVDEFDKSSKGRKLPKKKSSLSAELAKK